MINPPPCASDPDRWGEAKAIDPGARLLCWQDCRMLSQCAQIALDGAQSQILPTGIWGGVFLPEPRFNPHTRIAALRLLHRVANMEFGGQR